MSLKRVACLYRVSTKAQLSRSHVRAGHETLGQPHEDIPMQVKACEDFIKKQRTWKLEKEYIEKGVSGYHKSADERDALVQLKNDAAAGTFDVLLVFMFDRLGRREDETPFIVEWLVAQNIEVWSVKEGQQCFGDHTDKLINYMRYWQSGGESEHTSMRVAEKHNQLVRDGKFRGGVAPYGYTLEYSGEYNRKGHERKKLLIYEPEAMVVSRVFELSCDANMGSYRVAKILNAEGIATRTGKLWTVPAIVRMLRNPVYMGDYVAGKARRKRGKLVATQKETWVHSRELVEELAIVLPSIWEAANANISLRDTKAKKICEKLPKSDFLLSEVLYCGYCKVKLHPRTRPTKRKLKGTGEIAVYRSKYYNCPKKSRLGDCDGQFQYGIVRVETLVLDEVYSYLDNIKAMDVPRLARSQKARLLEEQAQVLKLNLKKISSLRKEVARLEAEILKCLMGESVFTEKQLSDTMKDKTDALSVLEKENDSLNAEMGAIAGHIDELIALKKSAVSWKDEFAKADTRRQRQLIGLMVERIYITRESLDISFKYKFYN